MATKILILSAYFLVVLAIGYFTRTHWRSTPAAYFLADRGLGTLVLLATMTATNFSAFTVFGTSGAGYRDGWSFFPIMGFGTGFMALSFWVIGRKVWQVGRERGLITPPELVHALYRSRPLGLLFALVMIVFTIPYLALQPMAAGYALQELTGLPFRWGSALVTGVILLYTLRGGMRSVAWTDLFQGILLLALLAAALSVVAGHHGGFAAASAKVLALKPELFARPGGLGHYTPGIWFSYMALWFLCDPMFPQLFQRFFAAKSEQAIARMMLLYPLVCTVVFLPPIAVGVLGHLSFPDLAGKQADRVLPMVVNALAGDVMAALVTAAGLAALMSTMDSQLLTLSSIFSRDILPAVGRRAEASSSIPGRIFVVGLSAAGLLLAWHPPATILEIATETFTGLAVLFPTVLFGLYWRQVFPAPAILSILIGEAVLICFHFKWMGADPFLPVVWVMLAAFGAYLAADGLIRLRRRQGGLSLRLPTWSADPSVLMFAAVFLLAMDVWAWGRVGPMVAGLPLWIAHFLSLSVLQTAVMAFMLHRAGIKGCQRAETA